MTPELAAVIVNYNAGAELRTALQSIADEMTGRAWEAVVVDNASTDGSADIAAEFAPHARIVRNTDQRRIRPRHQSGCVRVECAARADHESRLPARARRRGDDAGGARVASASARLSDRGCSILTARCREALAAIRTCSPGFSVAPARCEDSSRHRRLHGAMSSAELSAATARSWTGCPAPACSCAAQRLTRSAGSTRDTFCTGRTPICAGVYVRTVTRFATSRRYRRASGRPFQPHRPRGVDQGVPRKRVSLLHDARRAGCTQSQAPARAPAARRAMLVATAKRVTARDFARETNSGGAETRRLSLRHDCTCSHQEKTSAPPRLRCFVRQEKSRAVILRRMCSHRISSTSPATCSPIERHDVSPGDSMPAA